VVSAVVFVVARLTGDPVRLMLPVEASSEEVARVRLQGAVDERTVVAGGPPVRESQVHRHGDDLETAPRRPHHHRP